MNEHVLDRQAHKKHQLDFSNIVASCTTPNQCDDAHKTQELPLTPLMDECETELKFCVKGATERAETSINVLQLSNRGLATKRKALVEALIFEKGEQPHELALLDDELIELLIDDVSTPDTNGLLKPFSPVLVNILRGQNNL